jgi:hypothetical protein
MKAVRTFTRNQRNAIPAMLEPNDHLWDIVHKIYDDACNSLVDSLIRQDAKAKGWITAVDECTALRNRILGYEAQLASHAVILDGHSRLYSEGKVTATLPPQRIRNGKS